MKRLKQVASRPFPVAGNAQIHLVKNAKGQLFLGVCELPETAETNLYTLVRQAAAPENDHSFRLYRANGTEWEEIFYGAGVFWTEPSDPSALRFGVDCHRYMQDDPERERLVILLYCRMDEEWVTFLLALDYDGNPKSTVRLPLLRQYRITSDGDYLAWAYGHTETEQSKAVTHEDMDLWNRKPDQLQRWAATGKLCWSSPLFLEYISDSITGPKELHCISETRCVVLYEEPNGKNVPVTFAAHLFDALTGREICVLSEHLHPLCGLRVTATENGFCIDTDAYGDLYQIPEPLQEIPYLDRPHNSYHLEYDNWGKPRGRTVAPYKAPPQKVPRIVLRGTSYKIHGWRLQYIDENGDVQWQKPFNIPYGGQIEYETYGELLCVIKGAYSGSAEVVFFKIPG